MNKNGHIPRAPASKPSEPIREQSVTPSHFSQSGAATTGLGSRCSPSPTTSTYGHYLSTLSHSRAQPPFLPKSNDSKTKDLVEERTENRRTSGPKETHGEDPHAYPGYSKGVPTANTTNRSYPVTILANDTAARPQAEHLYGNHNGIQNDLDSRSGPQPVLTISPTEQIITVEPSAFRTTFKMVINMEGERTLTRMVQLDTGSSVNLLSELVVADLGKSLEPYDGKVIPLGDGEPIRPLGKVTLDWHVMGKPKTYTDTFLVLDDASSQDFDVLLSRDTIGRVGFYKTDDKVWVLSLGGR
ncbi:MAG: hypothetical protein HETSPECPRED_004837 [Heterodermia speciosa]|uniref:Peptidase A2 domain-containing protein n=1 Tax=Heterodermia speciosa TaxID=116794 RepID=A0A8H3EL87_9LECA|nr:MAG: hypothetical protein HETSPECPRED_004837 [Heterodermia speciosa]